MRPRLEAFAGEMFGGFARSDQRAKGELYVRGLMLDGKRKSMQPMAARLGVDHQRPQHFVSSSTWDHREVGRWAAGLVRPEAYVVDDTGFPKDGADSPGVARMYSGSLGKVGNCQIGVSVHTVTDWASAAINRRLFMPSSWDDEETVDPDVVDETRRRQARCGIPDTARHREKWRLALVAEGQELLVAVAGFAGGGDFAGGVLECREQGGDAVLAVVVGPARGASGLHRQRRRGAVQRLDLWGRRPRAPPNPACGLSPHRALPG